MSTLLTNRYEPTRTRGDLINTQIRETVIPHYTGKRIVLAEMDDGFITEDDLNGDTHPTDYGYEKMASVWWAALQVAETDGLLLAPPDTGFSDNGTASDEFTCPKVYGAGDGNYQIQKGSGTDDGPYIHTSEDQGVVWTSPDQILAGTTDYGDNLFFAQLVNAGGATARGSEVDEIVWVSGSVDDGWSWQYSINNNDNVFGDAVIFDPGYTCTPEASRFADMNNNGLDDYICVASDGSLWASINEGGNPPVFGEVGQIAPAPSFWSDGYTVDLVHFADIDGDGWADWCILLHVGDIACLRNGGYGAMPTTTYNGFWQNFANGGPEFTTVFPSQNKGNAAGVNLVDINGDFKTDWLFMDTTGQVDTFINNRGNGDGMVPDWQDAGITHGGLSSFGVANANSVVKFGRMYGTGRRDYIWIVATAATWPFVDISIRIWKNTGAGGTYLKGDGSHYCDMDGDGVDDYIWVSPNSEIDIYLNTDNRPYWGVNLGVVTLGVPRENIRIADLDGDGKCDLVSVDPTSGEVRMWLNSYDVSTTTWTFSDKGIVSTLAICGWGNGVVENDFAVRLADLTNNGKADYLCLDVDGTVTGFLNRGMSGDGQIDFEDVGQIKLATHYDRQNVRFNDVNGDGFADLLWIDKFTGDTRVWYNDGEIMTSGSHFKWADMGVLYEAWDRGSNMAFGALGGQHRADIIQVIPRTNIAYISYNKCPITGSGSGGDDPDMGDPDLPAYTRGDECVDTNGDGSCELVISPDIGISLPIDTFLPGFDSSVSYSAGDIFYFDTFDDSDLSLDIMLVGEPTQWEDFDCGTVIAEGAEGDTLGCIAISVAWLTYSIYLQGGPVVTTPARSLLSSDHYFQPHSEWQSQPNCTTRCLLLNGTPQHTWTPVGNGSYNGVYHELHFMHTDNFTGYRAYQNGQSGDTALAYRQISLTEVNPLNRYLRTDLYTDLASETENYTPDFNADGSLLDVAGVYGTSFSDVVATTNFSAGCAMLANMNTNASTAIIGVSPAELDYAPPEGVSQALKNCAAAAANLDDTVGINLIQCGMNLTYIDPDLLINPDGVSNPDIWDRSLHKRAISPAHPYTIYNIDDLSDVSLEWNSAPYYNGDHGVALQENGGDMHVYSIAHPSDCWDASLRDDQPLNAGVDVNAEHIVERQTIPAFLDFVQRPTLDLDDGNGPTSAPAELQIIHFSTIRDFMALPYDQWPDIPANILAGLEFEPDQSLFTDIAISLGSISNMGVMPNLQQSLNLLKAKFWMYDTAPNGALIWAKLEKATPVKTRSIPALELLRAGISVFNYLNDDNVQTMLGQIHADMRKATAKFDETFTRFAAGISDDADTKPADNTEQLWIWFINAWTARLANRLLPYYTDHLKLWRDQWKLVATGGKTLQAKSDAADFVVQFNLLIDELPNVKFDRTKLDGSRFTTTSASSTPTPTP